jgi:hypothetical protein
MRARWLLLPLLLALQACSGTTFGQKLADSFDSPATPAAAQQNPNTNSGQESAISEKAAGKRRRPARKGQGEVRDRVGL